jgi:hypothetical protein
MCWAKREIADGVIVGELVCLLGELKAQANNQRGESVLGSPRWLCFSLQLTNQPTS